jgi:hypothetical protein
MGQEIVKNQEFSLIPRVLLFSLTMWPLGVPQALAFPDLIVWDCHDPTVRGCQPFYFAVWSMAIAKNF